MKLVNRPPAKQRWTGPNGEPIRAPRLLERLEQFATMNALGWSPQRIAFELGVSERTVSRYQARQQRGETMGFTEVEAEFWSVREWDSRPRRYSHTAWLKQQQGMGGRVVDREGRPVRHAPRVATDRSPWLLVGADPDDTSARSSGVDCRVIWPH